MIHILPSKKNLELPTPLSLRELASKLHLTEPHQAVAAKVNGTLTDFDTLVQDGDTVEFFSFEDPIGKEVFWHSSAHVLAQAILRLYPQVQPTIGPPIENGFYYDFAELEISDKDFAAIEEEVEKILKEQLVPKRQAFASKQEALQVFGQNPYKKELIESFEGDISGYRQGEFFDLCRGPHLPILSKIKAFKILKTSGAYWRADSTKEMLTRVYAISFPERKMLKDYLFLLEEAKKRDHKVLGAKLDLFSIHEMAPGMPFIHPKGMIIWNKIVEFWRDLHRKAKYVEIKTPQIMNRELWETSGHWDHYKHNMYCLSIEEKDVAIKPMNCPGCMLFFKHTNHSYRELPYRIAEIGHVHRYEASGALNGLFRVRSFHQDDAHVFMQKEDIYQEILAILELTDTIYSTFGLEYRFELSTRPEKSIGSDEDWAIATQGLQGALEQYGAPFKINEGDGAFYGPKIDIHIKDALGRSWQCGTIQLDMSLPERFQVEYMANDGHYTRPVMIHRAIFGSIERFFGILIEHFAGRFPLWISPRPIRVIAVADRHAAMAQQVLQTIEARGYLAEIDISSESVAKKIREAQLLQVNYMLILGDQEIETQKISVRTRTGEQISQIDIEDFLEKIEKEYKGKSLVSAFKNSQKSE